MLRRNSKPTPSDKRLLAQLEKELQTIIGKL